MIVNVETGKMSKNEGKGVFLNHVDNMTAFNTVINLSDFPEDLKSKLENIVNNETTNVNGTSKSINDIKETDFLKQISDSEKPATGRYVKINNKYVAYNSNNISHSKSKSINGLFTLDRSKFISTTNSLWKNLLPKLQQTVFNYRNESDNNFETIYKISKQGSKKINLDYTPYNKTTSIGGLLNSINTTYLNDELFKWKFITLANNISKEKVYNTLSKLSSKSTKQDILDAIYNVLPSKTNYKNIKNLAYTQFTKEPLW